MNQYHSAQAIPSTKELIKIYNLEANKRLGQNFLLDSSITDLILSYMPDIKNRTILEVGAGPAGLTRSILFKNPKKLYAIEYDERCIPILELVKRMYDNLEIIQADALQFDENIIQEDKISVIANLPYNIGSKLVLKWIHNLQKFDFIVVMLQKEVALRLVANVGTEHYSRLSVIIQAVTNVDVLFDLEPHHFYPSPKVYSTVIRLQPNDRFSTINLNLLGKITQVAFALKRKKIKTSLKSLLDQEDFAKLTLDPNKRAENLTVDEYLKITNFLSDTK